jgi:ribosomal protein L16 Arg81 hydroxylase
LRQALSDGRVQRRRIRLLRDGVCVPDMFYTDGNGLRMERLDQLLDGGCSLILEPLDSDMEALGAFADALRAVLCEYVTVGAVVTTGSRGALALHYDEEDVLALQVEGTKVWRLYAPTVVNPLKQGPRAPLPTDAPVLEVELAPGDMLFVPAGYWHECTNRGARSVHYSALMIPLSVTDVLTALHERLLADAHWRRPFGRTADLPADEAALKAHLETLLGELSLERLVTKRLARAPRQREEEAEPDR